MNDIKTVCVYSASSTKIPEIYFQAADELGRLLGERGLRVVNGAGNIGLMRAVSDATLAAGGTVTGVIPRFMVEQDWYHKAARWLRHLRGVARDHHLETARPVHQPDRDP